MKIHNFFILTVCLRSLTYRYASLVRLEKIVSGSWDILFPRSLLKINLQKKAVKQRIAVIKLIKYEKKKIGTFAFSYGSFNNSLSYIIQ